MRILGIDPGTRILGYGVVELKGNSLLPQVGGIIRTDKKHDRSSKLHQIHKNLLQVIKRAKPDVVAVEEVFYGVNVASLIKIGEARGAVLAACGQQGVVTYGYPPATVKKAVTGNGRATKAQVREMVMTLLGRNLELETDDVSDALAVAICHAHRARFNAIKAGE